MKINLIEKEKQEILRRNHNTEDTGHSRTRETVWKIWKDLKWKNLNKNTYIHVQLYNSYQRTNLIKALKIEQILQFSKLWEAVLINYIIKLP